LSLHIADSVPDATAKNTEHNTGSKSHDGAEKESVVDKIKDKLGMGHGHK